MTETTLKRLTMTVDEVRRLKAGEAVSVSVRVEPQPTRAADAKGEPFGPWRYYRTPERMAADDWTLGWWDEDGTCESLAKFCPFAVGDRVGVAEPWGRWFNGEIAYEENETHAAKWEMQGGRWQPAASLPVDHVRTFATVTAIDARLIDGEWRWLPTLQLAS